MSDVASTLRHFTGRCPTWGPTSLGLAWRHIGWLFLQRFAIVGLVLLCASLLPDAAHANEAVPAAADPVLEARMLAITAELRCLVCQNQTIADSHADLAVDLRQQVREMLQKGQTNQQILDYMTARYGDFVLYRPPFKNTTVLLWVGPGVMLIAGLVMLVLILRRRSRMPADQFDPDEPEVNGPADDSAQRPTH